MNLDTPYGPYGTRTFCLLCTRLPLDLAQYVFVFWIGKIDRGVPLDALAYAFARYNFPEGIDWCQTTYPSNTAMFNQMLYGSATRSDVVLSLRVIAYGATDLETAANLALERGDLRYVRTILYACKQPDVPLSMSCWIRGIRGCTKEIE